MPAKSLAAALGVDPEVGLGEQEVRMRLAHFGANQLERIGPRHVLRILADQFRSLVVGLLCLAALAAFFHGDALEALAVAVVIAINALIGFLTEWRATRSMEALRQLGHFEAVVLRDGRLQKIRAEQLVPGDVVPVEGGDMVSADLRLIRANGLQADESTLTGESAPVDKQAGTLPADTPLMERSNQLFKGTAVTRGSGTAIVVGTGPGTELGRIARLVRTAKAQETPLEKRLDTLGRRMIWLMLVLAVCIALAGMAAGHDTVLAIQVAVALMVAAIPEGLPIVATIALARGMWRMARRRALIVRLSAVETLGATGIILTDKTGTLTENRMSAAVLLIPGHRFEPGEDGAWTENGTRPESAAAERLGGLLQIAALCNNARLGPGPDPRQGAIGDPTEVALLLAAARHGLDPETMRAMHPRLREAPFDSASKCMATWHTEGERYRVAVKGAPEALLPRCSRQRALGDEQALDPAAAAAFLAEVEALGRQGLRTLALATRSAGSLDEHPFEDLVLLGAVGLLDPARAGVREAIRRCRSAGIRVVMVTGDHVATARKIACDIGLLDSPDQPGQAIDALAISRTGHARAGVLSGAQVIARVSPEQKFQLIRHFQAEGAVVAMTGDGVNDAPALKQADIGIAMGVRGTPVAREAAAMVLQDDRFDTIVAAIGQGRAIYANIRKFVVYLLSCNLSEVLIVGLATLAGAPLPLLPLQILFLNLVTDVFPALALGVGEGHAGLMQRPPRPAGESILCARHWTRIAAFGGVMAVCVLAAMGLARAWLGYTDSQAVTVSFCTLALSQVWHVFNMRDPASHWLDNEITRNPWIWGALVLCLLLVLGAVYLPALNTVLDLEAPGAAGWLLVLAMSGAPVLAEPLLRFAGAGSVRQQP